MNSFVHYFRFLIYFSLITFIQGTLTQTPSTACVGDRITVSCTLTPPAGQTFAALFPRFIIGNFTTSFSANNINDSSASHPDIDLTRLTAYTNAGSVTMVSGVVTLLSYLNSDEGLRIGCEVTLNTRMELIENIHLIQAAPPSAPNSLQSSVSIFNTATCSADISLSWNTPSDSTVDRYFLYLDGSPLATTNSNSYIHSTILTINTDYQYSVTAMSCAGNSTNSSVNIDSVKSYSLMNSSQSVCLTYDNVTRELTVNWELSTPTLPSGISGLNITYSLQLIYSQRRQGVTYTYTDSTSFTLPSSQLSYNSMLTAHNLAQLDGGETNITANSMIVQQCGQSFSGTTMECFLTIDIPENPTTTPISTSSPPMISSTSFGINSSNDTPTPTTPGIPLFIIIGSVVGAVILLFILITFIILLLILIFFLRRRKINPKQTGTDGTDAKDYQELGEDTYSEVKKKPKHKPEPVKKDECELNYLEIDHSSGTGKIVKPPIIPKTNYADINSFPQETQYASLQN